MKLNNLNFNRMTKTDNIQTKQSQSAFKANEVKFTGNVKQECVTIADFLADCAHTYGDKWCNNAKKIISESGQKTPEKQSLLGFFDAIGKLPGFLVKGKTTIEKVITITDTLFPKLVKDDSILERLSFMSERLKERSNNSELSKTMDEWKAYFSK